MSNQEAPRGESHQRFDGKVAVVAGGAGPGMGRATAKLLASLGARVVVLDVNDELGAETVDRIAEVQGEGTYLHADMTVEGEVRAAMQACVEKYGRLDLLFNNTGVASDSAKRVADFSLEEWERSIQLNLSSAFLGMKYAIPYMLENGGGSIVNNASVSGTRANVGGAPYGVAKAGVIHMTKVAALEYGGRGIRVNSVCPYSISRTERSLQDDLQYVESASERNAAMADLDKWQRAQLPMLRSGRGHEVAQAVAFLLSDAASWINGAALPVDGASGAGFFGSFR